MWIAHTVFYPAGAFLSALLAVYFFPVFDGSRGTLFYWIYYGTHYALGILCLWVSLLLLRRVVLRASILLCQLPVPLKRWIRLRHVFPLLTSLAVLLYLLSRFPVHVLVGCAIIAIMEITERIQRFSRERGPRHFHR